jgi:hypothetical protein
MTNYTKSTNFATKDTLPPGSALKIVRGTEIDTEFNSIATAIATKADIATPTFTTSITTPIVKSASSLVLQTNGTTTAVTIDTAQNMGLGVTPSAWSGFKALQIGAGGALANPNSLTRVDLTTNAYYNGSQDTYIGTGAATSYRQNGGQHIWYYAASGTAGGAISFNEAGRFDTSGNLLVGTTSVTNGVSGTETALTLQGNSSGKSASFVAVNNAGTGVGYFGVFTDNVTYLASKTNHALVLGTNNAERARIDSSGNLLVGSTSLSGINTNGGFSYSVSSGQGYSVHSHTSGTASGTPYQYFFYNNSVIGSITQSGTTAVLYNVMSDQRAKENIVDADSASTLIDALQVRKFDWKTDNTHQRYGFVAQELVTVAPEAVYQPANEDDMMAVDYSKLVPMLVKEIQSLRQRLAAANL